MIFNKLKRTYKTKKAFHQQEGLDQLITHSDLVNLVYLIKHVKVSNRLPKVAVKNHL
jgi:hypothetical protein